MHQATLNANACVSMPARAGMPNPSKKAQVRKKEKLTANHMQATWLCPRRDDDPTEIETTEDGDGDQKGGGDQKDDGAKTFWPDPVYTVDPRFVEFIKGVDSAGDERMEIARGFLLCGPPFKGKHDKHYKASIKELGLRWLKNPSFVEGEWTGEKFGWYVAHDIKELKAVLAMPRKADGSRAWEPCEFDELDTRQVIQLLEGYRTMQENEEEAVRRAREEERKAKAEKLAQESTRGAFELRDHEEDITYIRQQMIGAGYHDWVYDKETFASSAKSLYLGPSCSGNAVRILRALRLNLLTPDQVYHGQWETEATVKKRERAAELAKERKRKAEEAAEEQQKKQKLSNLKKKAADATQVLKSDAQLEAAQQGYGTIDDADPTSATSADLSLLSNFKTFEIEDLVLKPTTCHDCGVVINEQFLDCMCSKRAWKKCSVCKVGYCIAQSCACACA